MSNTRLVGAGLPCDGCREMCPECLANGDGNLAHCMGCLAKIADQISPGVWRMRKKYWGWNHALYVTDDAVGPEVACGICGGLTYVGIEGRDWFKCEPLADELEREVR